MEFILLALAILAIAARPSDPRDPRDARAIGAALNEDDDLCPKVHRCWNCWKAIPISATRCKHCGVSQ